MKSCIFFICFFLFSYSAYSQVGIGTTSPNALAKLDVSSSSKGFLLPRMTLLQRNAIASPSAGLQVWCTDCAANGILQIFNGTNWVNSAGVTTALSVPSAPLNPLIKVIGNHTVSVTFTPPTNNGGSLITSYKLTDTAGKIIDTSINCSFFIRGLIPRNSYVFNIMANNAVGSSLPTLCNSISIIDSFYWKLNGNSKITNDCFIGTSNTTNCQLKSNNIKRIEIDNLGHINLQNNVFNSASISIEKKTESYTLSANDNSKLLTFSANTTITLTVPDGLPVGFHVGILQTGLGQIEFIASNGVVLNNVNNLFSTVDTFSLVSIMSYATDELVLSGDLD
jgi:hypothetical protein